MFKLISSQFDETQESLKSIEENIRKITGRDPDSFNPPGSVMKWKGQVPAFRGRVNPGPLRKRPFKPNAEEPAIPVEEEEGEEDSPDEDVPKKKKPTLQSTVVATRKVTRSRRDTLEEQKGDKRIFARNRRMFGMILGTLQKFKSEETRRKDQSQKKAEVDKKVEQAAEKEKEVMKKEKEELFTMRKEKQIQMRCLEKKMELAEMHEVWEKNQRLLMNFIQTTANPPVMFLPAKHNLKSTKCLAESKERISSNILLNREKIEKELFEIEECYNRAPIDMELENIGDKENYIQEQDETNYDSVLEEQNVSDIIEDILDNSKMEETDILTDITEDNSRNETEQDESRQEESEVPEENKIVGDQDEFEPIYD